MCQGFVFCCSVADLDIAGKKPRDFDNINHLCCHLCMPGMLIAVVNTPFPPTFRSFFLLENSSLRLAFLPSQQNRVMSFPMLLLLAMDRAKAGHV